VLKVENKKDPSVSQLCINTANEQLHFYFNQFIFCWEREEYILEGIPVLLEEVRSNRDVLEVLMARPLGLFAILDEESKFPSANDSTFIAKLDSQLKGKSVGIYSR
jgi:myosin heavy subunit